MPRKAKGPRLRLKRYRDGRRWWIIVDGRSELGTSCREADLTGAERALAAYLASKYEPRRATTSLDKLLIADVINVYVKEVGPHTKNPSFVRVTALPILDWWGVKTLADIRGQTCRDYVTWRTSQRSKTSKRLVSEATARHDLKTLRAAINHFHAEYGPLPAVPKISLPSKPPAKDRHLTKGEAAQFLIAAHRARARHVVRFLLLGLHTATRSGAILALRWLPSTSGGWIDVDRGLLYRAASGATQTRKRQPPAKIPPKLLPWLRRWKAEDEARGRSYVINYDGVGVTKLRRSWATVRGLAGLSADVTPHTLRHTAITWQMQSGTPAWEVAGWAGLSVQMIDEVYGHHSPAYQRNIGAPKTRSE